ncbi:hypothetical protein FSARC_13841 [Fusarium sarcochroum]|uniref:Uncharacterized protein n=1 Tax=Fusarium sarcochroum TaxID=1208366 RepID=A0A8H4WRF3_9HYPO|nr:hypothetical protein FSARC_13841 [Fusarium sarcochroum]
MVAITTSFVLEYTWRGILLLIELVVLATLFFGIPGTSVYLLWVSSQHLQSDEFYFAKEALVCQVFHSLFLTLTIWGTVPYYSVRESLSVHTRVLTTATFQVLFFVYSLSSGAAITIMFLWYFDFESAGMADLASQCQAIAAFLLVVWCLALVLFIVFLYYEKFGFPSPMKQMFSDLGRLLHGQNPSDTVEDKGFYE